MDTEDVVVKEVAPVRVAELSGVAAGYETAAIGPVIQPLYPELMRRLAVAGVTPTGPGIAYYVPVAEGEEITVHAGVQVAADPRPEHDFDVVDLPAIERVAAIIHRGPMDYVERSIQTLAQWIEENGYRTDGHAREVYLDYCPDDLENSVTEIQLTITKA